MKRVATGALALVRGAGLIQLILGGLFWTGNALSLVPLHMLVGSILVLALWVLAGCAAVAGVHWGRVALVAVWGLVVPILGVTQGQLLPGPGHWVIEVLHLLVGLGAIGQAEGLARRIVGRRQASRRPAGAGAPG
jgi:hypothetical protein